MSDYIQIPKDEFNLLKNMPGLRTQIIKQKSQCCWAISVATVLGYKYYIKKKKGLKDMEGLNFEVSPQYIIDKIWFYSEDVRKRMRDKRGAWLYNFRAILMVMLEISAHEC